MLLGFWTSKALLKRSHPAVARRARMGIVRSLIGRPSSVAQVDGNDPLHQLRYVSLLPRAEVAAPSPAEEHCLGLESGVPSPGVQIPAGKRHHRAARPDGFGPEVGQRV